MSGGLLSAADVRSLLDRHGIAPAKRRGQNFVVDPNTVRKVVRDAGVTAGDLVCEIGPGLGSLTLALRQAGASVVAVEVDAGLVSALREVAGDDAGVRIVHGDALRIDLAELVVGADHRPLLISNLPYNVATPIVMRALETGVFARLLVMVQREVGERWVARPGDPAHGAVSIKIAAQARARVVAPVSRRAFWPVPNVDSVTVALEPVAWEHGVDRDHLFGLVEAGFAQRRKRLRNAMATAERPAAVIEQALVEAGLDPGARAEELHLPEWVALARLL